MLNACERAATRYSSLARMRWTSRRNDSPYHRGLRIWPPGLPERNATSGFASYSG